MALNAETAKLCGILNSNPEMFQEPIAFLDAIEELIKTSVASIQDLAALKAFRLLIDDDFLLEKAIKRIKVNEIKKILSVVDRHWEMPKNSGAAFVDHLVHLIKGSIDPASDKTLRDQEIKSQEKIINDSQDILSAQSSIKDNNIDVVLVLSKMTTATHKRLVKKFDKHLDGLSVMSAAQMKTHLHGLLSKTIEPTSAPEKVRKTASRSGKKPRRIDPMKSTVMSAKWDGIDRD